jgi:hypothetical protein
VHACVEEGRKAMLLWHNTKQGRTGSQNECCILATVIDESVVVLLFLPVANSHSWGWRERERERERESCILVP